MKNKNFKLVPLAISLGLVFSLSACGGGGGGPSSSSTSIGTLSTTMTGSAIDKPISNANIIITANAPYQESGSQTLGTMTADSSAKFSGSINLPNTNVPVFANAVDPNNSQIILTSYIGQANTLGGLTNISSSDVPDLDVSPVTTATLIVYQQLNGNFNNLTPTTYAQTLQKYKTAILVIASVIKEKGDQLCSLPSSLSSNTTITLAQLIASSTKINQGTVVDLSSISSLLGSSCSTLFTVLPQELESDSIFGPQLSLGDVVDKNVQVVTAGTYQSQMLLSALSNTSNSTSTLPAPTILNESLTIDGSGNITSSNQSITGTIVGNLAQLQYVHNGITYSLKGKISVLNSSISTNSPTYFLNAFGNDPSTNNNYNLQAVITNGNPVWTSINTNNQDSSFSCSTGSFPLRLESFGQNVGGASVGECVSPSATGFSMISASNGDYDFENNTSTPPSFTANNWSEISGSGYILSSPNASLTQNGTTVTGTAYYIMGSQSIVFNNNLSNNILKMDGFSLVSSSEGEKDNQDH
jgi:hypothetical protein